MSMSTVPGRRASTASTLGSRTATQPGPLSAQARSVMSSRLMPKSAAMCLASGSSTGPGRASRGAGEGRPAFLDEPLGEGWLTPGLQPRVAGAQGGVAGEGQLPAGGEDAYLVVGLL